MPQKPKYENDFYYFSICKNCMDEECCAEPYFTFIARNEIEKIKDKIVMFPKNFQDFLEVDEIIYKELSHPWYGIKKINGRCIFLKNRRVCMIQDVKPLHCRCYPLVWSYEEEGNTLFIYIDDNRECALVPILSKKEQWIEKMRKTIIAEVQQMSMIDRIAYKLLESDDTLRLIDIINLKK